MVEPGDGEKTERRLQKNLQGAFSNPPTNEQYSEKETAARRDETIKRMIAMPPKPHSEMKIGDKAKKKKAAKKKKKTD
jgi:hypothetical protein